MAIDFHNPREIVLPLSDLLPYPAGTEERTLIVAGADPRDFRYILSPSSECMDRTNWDEVVRALRGDSPYSLPENRDQPREADSFDALYDDRADWAIIKSSELMRGLDAAGASYRVGEFGMFRDPEYLVIMEDTNAADLWHDLVSAYGMYPILDEDTYMEEAREAWNNLLDSDVLPGVATGVAYELVPEDHDAEREDRDRADDLRGTIEEILMEYDYAWSGVAQEGMSYFDEWGEDDYDEEGAVDAVVNWLRVGPLGWRMRGPIGKDERNNYRDIMEEFKDIGFNVKEVR